MAKNSVILVLGLLIVFLSDRLVREENQRYALILSLCGDSTAPAVTRFNCLESAQSRTSWFGHLYSALTDHLPAVPVL